MIVDAHADILTDISHKREKGERDVFKNRNLENDKKTYYDFIKTLFTCVNYHNM